jgi:uncharacterized protein (TIGR03437 family)
MALRGLVLSLLGLWGCVTALDAQFLPCEVDQAAGTSQNCAEGASFSFDFGQLFELSELSSIINSIDGASFTYNIAVTAGALPSGLSLSSSGLLGGTLTAAGQYSFTITLTEMLAFEGQTLFDQSIPFPLAFTVTGYTGPQLTIDPSGLSFSLTASGTPTTGSVTIDNHGSKAVAFSASASTNSGGNWLRLSGASSAGPFQSAALAVTADPSHLTPGTYSGTITVAVVGGQTLGISVVAAVTGSQPNIQLSQNGLRFQAVSGGTATSPQTITVLNPGAGTLNFSATGSTITGGNWLNVTPTSGSSSAKSAGSVAVSVNASGLAPGDYYGTIQFASSAASNSPQVASVVLNVLTPANSPGAFVQPTGLIFLGVAGGTNPTAKTISITNPSPDPLTFLATSFSNSTGTSGSGTGGLNWFTASPPSGSVSATQAATVSVQPTLTGLAAGVYTGDLTITIAPSSTTTTSTAAAQVYHIEVLLLVLPAGSVLPTGSSLPKGSASETELRPHAAGCVPTQLLPVFTLLGTGFTAAAAWPTAIEVTVVDDCGTPLTSGSVTATFSSGDPALPLNSLNNGRWTATWNPTHASTGVTITAHGQEVQPALTGSASIGGALQPNNGTPAVSTGGVVSAANFAANQPLAPGSFAAIFGSNLSGGLNVSTQLPLGLKLGDTSVLLGGERLPLLFTSGLQVNVVLPYDLPVNSTQQLVVQSGSAISIPQSVVIAPAQPAIFTQNGFGTLGALINVYKPDGTPLPNNSPVSTGYVIVLYASGLGAVDPPIPAGSPAPTTTLSHTVNTVTATIGSLPAQVLFAGLAPSFAQLYQVNIQIPPGLPSGDATLTLSVGGQQSAPVTITVK